VTTVELRDVFCVHRTAQGDAAALQGLNLDVLAGERVCVLGPSGAGKTTLLRVIAGLQTPSAGVVRVVGRDIGRASARARGRIRHETIGFLDQHAEAALTPELSVGQAVGMPLALRGVGRHERRARVAELLDAIDLGDRAAALPEALSGGERQRVALCAALAHRPAILLADEPTAELDRDAADVVDELISRLATTYSVTVIAVSHDPSSAARADRTVWIRGGRIVEDQRDGVLATTVDPAGGLSIAPALLREAGILPDPESGGRGALGGRVQVRRVDGGLLISPAGTRARDGEAGAIAPGLGTDGAAADRAVADGTAADGAVARGPVRSAEAGRAGEREARPGGVSRYSWAPALVELRAVSRGVGRGVRRRIVLDGLSVGFAAGRLTVVTGRSGAGKTTLLRLVAGLDVPDSGEVLVDGRPVGRLDREQAAELRRERIGYLAQEPAPVGFLSPIENVRLAQRLRGQDGVRAGELAAEVLADLGLTDRAGQRVDRLSAGETQRVALARAVAGARGLLIVDEPTSRLDEASAELVAVLLARVAAERGQTVICATHDARLIRVADDTVRLG
jgi:ABC-type lipoprotein export system ATPase subunit